MKYETVRSEFKGHPVLEFHQAGSRGNFPALTVGVKKCKVIEEIACNKALLAELLQFLEDSEPKEPNPTAHHVAVGLGEE